MLYPKEDKETRTLMYAVSSPLLLFISEIVEDVQLKGTNRHRILMVISPIGENVQTVEYIEQ